MQTDEGWEEFFDYIFPEDEATKPNLKLLASAKAWKKKQEDNNDGRDVANELWCLYVNYWLYKNNVAGVNIFYVIMYY